MVSRNLNSKIGSTGFSVKYLNNKTYARYALNQLLENKSQLATKSLFPSQQIEIKNDGFIDAFLLTIKKQFQFPL
jgi:hypothetical protein